MVLALFQNALLGVGYKKYNNSPFKMLLVVKIYVTIIRGMFHFFVWKPLDAIFVSTMNLVNGKQDAKELEEEGTSGNAFSKRLVELSTKVQQLGESVIQTVDTYKWTWITYFAFVVFINVSLIIGSVLSYAVLYYNFMPDVSQLEVPLYFDFERYAFVVHSRLKLL